MSRLYVLVVSLSVSASTTEICVRDIKRFFRKNFLKDPCIHQYPSFNTENDQHIVKTYVNPDQNIYRIHTKCMQYTQGIHTQTKGEKITYFEWNQYNNNNNKNNNKHSNAMTCSEPTFFFVGKKICFFVNFNWFSLNDNTRMLDSDSSS